MTTDLSTHNGKIHIDIHFYDVFKLVVYATVSVFLMSPIFAGIGIGAFAVFKLWVKS